MSEDAHDSLEADWGPRQVARTALPRWNAAVSTVLLTDGSAFETKVFPGDLWDYEIQVGFRDMAMANHVTAVDRIRTGRTLAGRWGMGWVGPGPQPAGGPEWFGAKKD